MAGMTQNKDLNLKEEINSSVIWSVVCTRDICRYPRRVHAAGEATRKDSWRKEKKWDLCCLFFYWMWHVFGCSCQKLISGQTWKPLVVTKVDPFWQKPNIPLSEGLGAQVRNMSVSSNYIFQCGSRGVHVSALLSLDHEINFSCTLTCTLTVHMSSVLSNLTL